MACHAAVAAAASATDLCVGKVCTCPSQCKVARCTTSAGQCTCRNKPNNTPCSIGTCQSGICTRMPSPSPKPSSPSPSPKISPSLTPCAWQGHCAGDPCTSENDCDGSLICVSGKCGSSAPPPTPSPSAPRPSPSPSRQLSPSPSPSAPQPGQVSQP